MNSLVRGVCLTAAMAVAAAAGPQAIQAQEIHPQNVISANPLGLLLDFFNAEYERAINPTSTVGIGGSTSQ